MLTIPLSNFVYAPWVIDRAEYTRLGLSMENLVLYKGFLVMSWLPTTKIDNNIISKVGLDPKKKVVVFRESELGASYLSGAKDITLSAVKELATVYPDIQFVTRPRYYKSHLEDYFSEYNNVTIFQKPVNLQSIIAHADLLLGGGATMSLEASYFCTPVITCRQISSPITKWLQETGLAVEANDTDQIKYHFKVLLGKRTDKISHKIFNELEFPHDILYKNITGE